jgi:alpha-galactosidase
VNSNSGRLLIVGVFSALIASSGLGAEDSDASLAKATETQWTRNHLIDTQAHYPFSFTYDGQPSARLLASWPKKVLDARLDAQRMQHTLTWTDEKTGLEVKCVAVEFTDYPVVEWTVFFRNTRNANTPILETIKAIDVQLPAEGSTVPHLHFINGDSEVHGDLQFAPQDWVLDPAAEARFASLNGRPTDPCFPYYNLDWKGVGAIVVLGWPGQWTASFTADGEGNVQVRGGQELTHLELRPDEEVRTPRMVMLFWKGGMWIDSQNLWRRWMRAHNMPKPGGKEVPVIRAASVGGLANSGQSLMNEKDQIAFMDRYPQEGIKLNVWWMDIYAAGTLSSPYTDKYITSSFQTIVTWDTDRTRFPHGLRAISDHARISGERLLVWFEPEHVWDPNVLHRDHPDWLLSVPDDPKIKSQINQGVPLGNRKLLNLGNPQARHWMTDLLCRLIRDEGIGVYRQDFNIEPLVFWRHNDSSDRQGMTENLYVQGYLKFLDALQSRFPDMLIDTCASGGRRDDLETLRRAVPLWRSDHWGPNAAQQNQTYGLALWLPYFGTAAGMDAYSYRSSLGSSVGTGWDVRDRNLDYPLLRKLEAEFWRAAPFFREDYYPLTSFDPRETAWMAWQFNRPSRGDGIVQAFRRERADDGTKSFPLHHLDPSALYEITNLDSGASYSASGGELMGKGLALEIRDKPGALVIAYARAK